jgi:hypothetical protein
MAESPEEQFERFRNIVQNSILKAYPNPNREGCPGEAVVREVAARKELHTDDHWQHITHCSPCYSEFLRFKDEFRTAAARRTSTTRRRVVVATGILVTTGVAAFVFRERENRVHLVEVDLQNYATYRGVGEGTPRDSRIRMPRGRVHLVLLLVPGAVAGQYDIQLWSDPTRDPILVRKAQSATRNGREALQTDLDLRLRPGTYMLGVRNDDRSWRYYPVEVFD